MTTRHLAVLVLITGVSVVGSTVQAQTTLAEAAAAAAKIKHEWPVSTNQVPLFDPEKVPVPPDIPAADVTTEPATKTPTTVSKKDDEATWKTRMRTLTTARDTDQAALTAAIAREHTLDTTVHHPSLFDAAAIRDAQSPAVMESWQAAVTDVSRLTALVQSDTRQMGDLELEAHRAGVPAGWLRLE